MFFISVRAEILEARYFMTTMRSLVIFIYATIVYASAFSQEINNYSTFFDVRDSSYTRISYDNDLFRGTDQFYTQGIGIDVYSYRLRKNPLNAILLSLKDSDRDRFGIEFRTHGCTPTTILSDSVLIGDRPFAGVFSLGIVKTSQLKQQKMRLTSQFELGMIGPAALGRETQTGIHKITGDDIPLGWQHQIGNAPIINYLLRIDKGTPLAIPSIFNSNVFGQAKLGTFQSNISTGFEFSVGRLNAPFSSSNRRYSFYLYSQSSVTFVGYDASLMGGILNRDGYHLTYSEMNTFVFRQNLGLAFGTPHFSLGFQFVFVSREIKESTSHSWGGVRLTFY